MALTTYPQPGSNAERVLNHIQANPGITINSLVRDLGINPSPLRRAYLSRLIEKGLIEDRASDGAHHYHAVNPVL